MALATQCPHCFTIFRVAGDQLKLRGGLVRCGSCRQVFNGQEFLVEASVSDGHYQPAPGSKARFGSVTPTPSVVAPAPSTQPGVQPDPVPEVNAAVIPAAPAPAPSTLHEAAPVPIPAVPEPKVFRSPASPAYIPLNTVSEPEPAAPVDHVPQPDVPDVHEEINTAALLRRSSAEEEQDGEPPAGGDDPFKADEKAADHDDAAAAGKADDVGGTDDGTGEDEEAEDDEEEDPADAPSFVKSAERKERVSHVMKMVMMIAAGVMVPVLLLQSIYYWRNQLAVVAPPLRPMLNGMCTAFHCTVGLPARIEQLTLESNELQVVPPNQNIYALALVLRNRDSEPQAWPAIELTLNNDDEKPVVRRVFRPRDYLANPQALETGIAAGSEQQVKLTFELNDALVSGYRIYLFYP